jgi:hypothetical protein
VGEAFRPAADERATSERLAQEHGYDNATLSAQIDAWMAKRGRNVDGQVVCVYGAPEFWGDRMLREMRETRDWRRQGFQILSVRLAGAHG